MDITTRTEGGGNRRGRQQLCHLEDDGRKEEECYNKLTISNNQGNFIICASLWDTAFAPHSFIWHVSKKLSFVIPRVSFMKIPLKSMTFATHTNHCKHHASKSSDTWHSLREDRYAFCRSRVKVSSTVLSPSGVPSLNGSDKLLF